ncbi:MAG: hypothetical protein MJ237_07975 [bacterium]|nr:hypothetical protein [bacterium]
MSKIKLETNKTLKGYVAINENNKAFYIPEGDSVELTVLRVLEGEYFSIIDLSNIDSNMIKHIQKV